MDYTEKRGHPPYAPRLMVRLLIYGYTTGVRSSHKDMSYGRLVDKEEQVEAEIAELETKAAALTG
ncbi:hypothetical protein FRAHR75_290067 [Frankia sp. Hr75.2]|nr:hypothetical protein FRAHR75_290067 [Frankia sp. Hr75.2]